MASSGRPPETVTQADVAELVDAHASGACERKFVWVRVPPSAPCLVARNCDLLSTPRQGIIGPLIGIGDGICVKSTYYMRPGGEMVYTYA